MPPELPDDVWKLAVAPLAGQPHDPLTRRRPEGDDGGLLGPRRSLG